MSTIRRSVCLVLIATIAAGCAAPTPDQFIPCDPPPRQTHKLKFKLKDTGTDKDCVAQVLKDDGTDGTQVSVCRGDIVQWKVKWLSRKKSVAFDKGDGSPFDWSDSDYQGAKILGEVQPGAAAKSYSYSVRTKGPEGGCPLDPIIIVRP